MKNAQFIPLGIAVLTVSDTRDEAGDKSGALLVERIKAAHHRCVEKRIVPDDVARIQTELSAWIANDEVDAVLTTGGTGLTGRDNTPEAAREMFDKTIDGFGEMFRVLSYATIGTSTLQSRAIAGVAGGTFIFCLPGSPGACADAWDKLISHQLDHRTRPCNLVELRPRLAARNG